MAAITGQATKEVRETTFIYGLWLLFILSVFAIVYAVIIWAQREDEESADGWLVVAGRIIAVALGEAYKAAHGADGAVTVTPYCFDGKHLVEVGQPSDREPRRIGRNIGAVGVAFTTRALVVGVRRSADLSDFRSQLAEEYAMPLDLIGSVKTTVWSWAAVPIKVAGLSFVVFADSSRADCFEQPKGTALATGISALLLDLCQGMREHLIEYG